MNRTPSLFAGVEPIEVFVELLDQLDSDTGQEEFYDRICEAICRLTTMRRAGIFMSEGRGHRIRAVGAHGISLEQLTALRPTLLGTPVAQRALRSDRVIVVTPDQIRAAVPPDYVDTLGMTTLVCTPLSAAGRSYGVICADRGGAPFEVSDGEQHLLWTLGKTAALVATARITTREEEQARQLSERLALAREIHEQVVQRLFGVSLALSAEKALDPEERERCRVEMQEALSDLRSALERPLAAVAHETGTTLAAELARVVQAPGPRVRVDWPAEVTVPAEVEPVAQSVLAEALRNIAKHAAPTLVHVAVSSDDDTFSLEVRNDGVGPGARGAGMGLRLAAFEALQHGGVVDFGAPEAGVWRVRLVAPRAGLRP
jgi:signal transduction histidine kinase